MIVNLRFYKEVFWSLVRLPIRPRSIFSKLSWLILQQSLEADTFLVGQAFHYGNAIVTDMISPDRVGQVNYQGSWWRAISEADDLLLPSTPVLVTGRIGLTLIVKSTFADLSY